MQTTKKLLELMSTSKNLSANYEGVLPSRNNVQELNKLSTEKLTALVKASIADDEAYQAQIIAARELLDRDTAERK
jgi:hypothetical protein